MSQSNTGRNGTGGPEKHLNRDTMKNMQLNISPGHKKSFDHAPNRPSNQVFGQGGHTLAEEADNTEESYIYEEEYYSETKEN